MGNECIVSIWSPSTVATGRPALSRSERRCRWPLYAEGSIGAERIRESLNLTSWDAAQRTVRGWEAAGTFLERTEISLEDALSKFIADCGTRNLKAVTLGPAR